MSPAHSTNIRQLPIAVLGSPLLEQDYDLLLKSWIDRDLADFCLLRRVTALEGAEIVGRLNSRNCAGLVFPYIWPGEQRVREYRLRRAPSSSPPPFPCRPR